MDLNTGQQGFFDNLGDFLGWGTTARANQININEAQKQRDWEEYMSSTSYQRAVDDMFKAGLNPGLAYQTGGADYHSGATGRAQGNLSNPNLPNMINSVANLVNSYSNSAKKNPKREVTTALKTISTLAKLMG